MGYSFWFDTIVLRWSFVYLKGSQVIIFQIRIVFLSLKIFFGLANTVDPDESSGSSLFAKVCI